MGWLRWLPGSTAIGFGPCSSPCGSAPRPGSRMSDRAGTCAFPQTAAHGFACKLQLFAFHALCRYAGDSSLIKATTLLQLIQM